MVAASVINSPAASADPISVEVNCWNGGGGWFYCQYSYGGGTAPYTIHWDVAFGDIINNVGPDEVRGHCTLDYNISVVLNVTDSAAGTAHSPTSWFRCERFAD